VDEYKMLEMVVEEAIAYALARSVKYREASQDVLDFLDDAGVREQMEDDVVSVFCEWFGFEGGSSSMVDIPPNNLN